MASHSPSSLALGAVLAFVPGWAFSQQLYRITDLGTVGGPRSTAVGINDAGQVTGDSLLADATTIHAFRFSAGKRMIDLGTFAACRKSDNLGRESSAAGIDGSGRVAGTSCHLQGPTRAFIAPPGQPRVNLGTLPGGHASFAAAINDRGQVTGLSSILIDGVTHTHAYRAVAGKPMIDLGVCPATPVGFPAELLEQNSQGMAINEAGQVVGRCENRWLDSSGIDFDVDHAFIASPGQPMADLGTLGGEFSIPFGINDAGQVTGYSSASGDQESHAFLWTEGIGMQDLGTLGGGFSAGIAINSAGSVAGVSLTDTNATHAFLWDGSAMRDLGSLGGTLVIVSAINDAGQVTGTSTLRNEGRRAFLSNGGRMKNLNGLVDPSDPLVPHVKLQDGVDINERGQIAANGCDRRTGECHAYLVTPLEYSIRFIAPASGFSGKQRTIVRVRAALVNKDGRRISDARAVSLLGVPCNVRLSATGGQTRSPVCMKYDATTNEYYFNWWLRADGVGATTLKVAATYRFSMPETVTTSGTRTVTITR